MTVVRFFGGATVGAGVLLIVLGSAQSTRADADPPAPTSRKVSYARDVRPLFQQHCMGCHQPAKAGGSYIMTSRDAMLQKGDSDEPGIVPGKPGASHLIAQLTSQGGKPPSMPRS